jgi:hypothetical protein
MWLYGTASKHIVLYQYQLYNAKDVFMGMVSFRFYAVCYWDANTAADPNGESVTIFHYQERLLHSRPR